MKKFYIYFLMFLFNFILFTDIYAEEIVRQTTLEPYERIVKTYEEMKDALSSDNGITTVYLGDDITMKVAGINIHSSKTNVYISGLNPLEPEKTEPYKLTEYPSTAIGSTINVSSNGIKSVILSDITVIGKNYYGSIGVYEISATDNLVVTYQRINYTGPQIGHHRRGTCKFIDCNVTITGDNGGSQNQEFAEARNLIFEGENIINSLSKDWSVFWHPTGGTFSIADNSSLYVTAEAAESYYGIYYADAGKISISVGEKSVYSIRTNESMNFPAQAVIDSFTLSEGSEFSLDTSESSLHPAMSVSGNLTVSENAKFLINGNPGSGTAQVLLAQRTGDITVKKDAEFHLTAKDTSSGAPLLLLYGRSFICDDPASVLLYNPNGRVIQAMLTDGKISINAEQINYWRSAGSGGFDDTPLYRWKKTDGKNFTLSGTIAYGQSGNIKSVSSNYENGDSDSGAAPDSSTFDMISSRVIAFGHHEIIMYEINESSEEISGKTSPDAMVRVSYEGDDDIFYESETISDENGFYSASVESEIQVKENSIVIARSKYKYLTAIASVTVTSSPNVEIPKLEVSIPDKIYFTKASIASHSQIVYRSDPDWMITVSDTRPEGSSWKIYSKISSPLTNSEHNISLSGSIVFIDNKGEIKSLNMTDPVLIDEHITVSGHDITEITWNYDKGILVYIPAGKVIPGVYNAVIEWIIYDVP